MLRKSYLTLFGCLLCSPFLFCSPALAAQQADFSWLPNNEVNLSGYKIYYSTVSGQYGQTIDVGNPGVVDGVVQATVTGLADGAIYYLQQQHMMLTDLKVIIPRKLSGHLQLRIR